MEKCRVADMVTELGFSCENPSKVINISCLRISFIAVDISSNLCGTSVVKVWEHLIKVSW